MATIIAKSGKPGVDPREQLKADLISTLEAQLALAKGGQLIALGLIAVCKDPLAGRVRIDLSSLGDPIPLIAGGEQLKRGLLDAAFDHHTKQEQVFGAPLGRRLSS
jgi:hypothetical protein